MKRLILLVSLFLLLISGCVNDGDNDDDSSPVIHPLVCTWLLTEEMQQGTQIRKIVFTEDEEYHILYERDYGLRDRRSGICTYSDTCFILYNNDLPSEFAYIIRNDTLFTDLGNYVSDGPPINPDLWLKYLIPVDSIATEDGDIAFGNGFLLHTAGWRCRYLYRYNINPLSLVDSLDLSDIGSINSPIEWDGSGLWCEHENAIKSIDLENLTFINSGPRYCAPNGFAWDGEKVWFTDYMDDALCSFIPGSETIVDSIDLSNLLFLEGLAFHDGYLFVCVEGQLYKCETNPFRIVQGFEFSFVIPDDDWYFIPQIVSVATDGNKDWILVTCGSSTTLYEVDL